jgi:uncharacterized membrane protein YfcA
LGSIRAVVGRAKIRPWADAAGKPPGDPYTPPSMPDPSELALIVAIGLAGGIAGGLLGLGGSVVMIPLLTFVLGPDQQLYQAACLIVNVPVGIVATVRHLRGGSIRGDLVRTMVPLAAIGSVLGVLLSNALDGKRLLVVFGAFLIYTAIAEAVGLVRTKEDHPPVDAVPRGLLRPIAALTGLSSGLLGIGGGTLLMPLLRGLARLPLRQAVGTSSAVTIVAATVGAIAKNATLSGVERSDGSPLTLTASLGLAALLAPTAVAGGFLGAGLVYRLRVTSVRWIFLILIGLSGIRMIVLGFAEDETAGTPTLDPGRLPP